jgi:hypothetical protein
MTSVLVLWGLALGFIQGCGKDSASSGTSNSVDSAAPPDSSAKCTSSNIQMGVFDGALVHLCGCAEPQGQKAVAGQTLTCTTVLGAHVTFLFLGKSLDHQILFFNSPWPSSPLHRGGNSSAAPAAYSVHFTQTGTFSFRDGPTLGRVIVQ